jgi:RNA polymerase sigma-70 factor, ECF subfamily
MSLTARDPTTPGQLADTTWLAEAVELARMGDRAAFDRLYQHFYVPISKSLARMVGNDEEGYDLAQETFLKAWQSLQGIRNASGFRAWLYSIATRIAIDHLRRRKFCSRWENSDGNGLPEKMWVSGPEDLVAEREHTGQALAQVSLKYRICLVLQLVADLSQREIAASLNLSEKSVSIYVSRGREQFRLAYQRLLQSSSELAQKKGAKIHENRNQRHIATTLYRLGAEARGHAPG